MLSAFIAAVAGLELAPSERDLLRRTRPCGVILFARNAAEPDQVRRLTDAIGAAIGEEVMILVDQEGGRVQRLKAPHWRALPPAAGYARAYRGDLARASRAVRLVARLMAEDLRAVGINTNCAPLIDVPARGGHGVIGDRAYAREPATVARLGAAAVEGLMAGGVAPVIKHMPGHGRATRDSHFHLPVVKAARAALETHDFLPFRALSGAPAGMTAHVVFTAFDATAPASTSARVIGEVIRGIIGFDGLLISDDLSMGALSGSVEARARAVLAAGCDVALACSGSLEENESVAAAVPSLQGAALTRFEGVRAAFQRREPFLVADAEAALREVCAGRPESV